MALYQNPKAQSWTYQYPTDVSLAQKFHKTLPDYAETKLVPLPLLAEELGICHLFVKDESTRFGLPAFKILGASWGVYRAICQRFGLSVDTSIQKVGLYAREQDLTLFAATDGNHGRAVARMAKILGVEMRVFVPRFTDEATRGRIESEGAEVLVVNGDYNAAIEKADNEANECAGGKGLLIQDNSFEGYEEVPAWIVEGYATMLREIEAQLADQGLKADVVVTPIGVGSLGQAVVSHCKSQGRGIRVLTIEPETAACLNASLRAGQETTVETSTTIMDGMNCGTVSPISWPILKEGVDASVTVTDWESHEAVQHLHANGVKAGPCGAGTLTGLRKVAAGNHDAIGLHKDSVVVLLCTEGERPYPVPQAP